MQRSPDLLHPGLRREDEAGVHGQPHAVPLQEQELQVPEGCGLSERMRRENGQERGFHFLFLLHYQ